jgi:ribose transport system substrate-binding protein
MLIRTLVALTAGALLLSGAPLPVAAPKDAPAPVQPAKKKLKVGISIPAADHGWTAGVGWWAKKATELYPDVDFVLSTALNPEKQTADIEDMLVKGVDAIVLLATESAPITPIALKAKQKGVFIVNVDRGLLPGPGGEAIADIFLEGDNKAFGRKSAEFMAEKLGGKGSIVVLTGIPCTVDTDRVNAAMEVFKRYPDIKILTQQPGFWSREKALQAMENILIKYPKIDAVWVSDDDMLLGVRQAVEDAGRAKQMWLLGGCCMKEVVKMMIDKDPMIPGNITYPPSMIAAGIQTCVGVLRDGKRDEIMKFMPRHLLIDVEIVTPETAKKYYFPESVF